MSRIVAILLFILFSPIYLLTSILIFLDSGFPILLRQKRSGVNNIPFKMFKFRTMEKDSHKKREDLNVYNKKTGPLFKLDEDPRLIRGGKIIRRFSLDELPQLINVINGSMSLVGPRPLFDTDRQHFKKGYMRRLNVLPGMTGLLQINDRNTDDFQVWFKNDMEYIENWNLYLDLKILIQTLPSLFNKKVQGK